LKRGLSLLRAAKALLGDQGKKASYKTIFSAGHGVGLIDSVKSAEEIILETMVGYRKAIASLP
jgi:hypothetical protein